MRPLLLDLFCGAGGMTRGYQDAGWYVIGVDLHPQPNYCGDVFFQCDWLDGLNRAFAGYPIDAIHASPPCQRFSDLARRNRNGDDWPDLIEPVREILTNNRVPYVIENVEGAPLEEPVVPCGTMFPGLRVIRHRLFECSFDIAPPRHPKHPLVFTHDKRKAHYGQLDQDSSYVQVTGGGNATLANKLDAMGTPWMRSHHEVNESIPPAYTEYVGKQLMEDIR